MELLQQAKNLVLGLDFECKTGDDRFKIGSKVIFHPGHHTTPMPCVIRGVHYYNGKTKYDLGLYYFDPENNGWKETRIYNVDSIVVFPL